jgi:hypothetical protein
LHFLALRFGVLYPVAEGKKILKIDDSISSYLDMLPSSFHDSILSWDEKSIECLLLGTMNKLDVVLRKKDLLQETWLGKKVDGRSYEITKKLFLHSFP